MTLGPNQNYPAGTYAGISLLRAAAPLQTMATIDVLDAQTNQGLVSQDVLAKDMIHGMIGQESR